MLFFTLISVSSLILLFAKSPFILCMSLIMLVSVFSIFLHSTTSFWFTYSLVIMFLGGMMVVFSYASSMNSGFKLNLKSLKLLNLFLLIPLLLYSSLEGLSYMKTMVKCPTNLNYSATMSSSMLIMIFLLLLTLFVIVKLVRVEEGPLKL